MAVAMPERHVFNADTYHRMGTSGIFPDDMHVELIEGDIVDMSPIGSRHAGTVMRLIRLFSQLSDKVALLNVQNPIEAGKFSEPQPDLSLLTPRDDDYTESLPTADDVLLVIEVADTSVSYDREIKIPLYAKGGIPEAWIIDLNQNCIEVYRNQSPGGYKSRRRFDPGESVTPINFPDVTIPVDGIF